MTRPSTYADQAFGRPDYIEDDDGDYVPNLVFVIMPFSDQASDETYRTIVEECEKLGLKATRADEPIGSGIVLSDITSMVEDAEFIICDLSLERPNVYYELGYAHGVGNRAEDILLIARAGSVLHFDIAPIRARFYDSQSHLREILSRQLGAMIEKTRAR